MTTRADHLRVIRDFDSRTIDYAITRLLIRKGLTLLDVLPDDMVAELAGHMLADWRYTRELNERNRAAK